MDQKRFSFTAEEEALLRTRAAELYADEIFDLLKPHTSGSIRSHAKAKGIKLKARSRKGARRHPKSFTEEQDALLEFFAGAVSIHELTELVGRDVHACHRRARKKGLSVEFDCRRWTKREDFALMALSERMGAAEVAHHLPNRTVIGVKNRMLTLGLHPYNARWSLQKAARDTGYNVQQLLRAKGGLGQTWVKKEGYRRIGRWLISEEQLEALCDWLRDEGKPDLDFGGEREGTHEADTPARPVGHRDRAARPAHSRAGAVSAANGLERTDLAG